MRAHRSAIVLGVLALTFACADPSTTPTGPDPGPQLAISDAVHGGGNEHFFLLPPMVPEPSPGGTFDGSLSPEVEVCAWNGSICTATLALFNTEAGYGSETIRVSEADEHYVVNWHTDEILDSYPLNAGEVYRIRIRAQGQELGHADLDVVGSGRDLRNVNTEEYVALVDGRTLPIKFRIEEGALVVGEIAAAGSRHSCAVATDGNAYCWGLNDQGQLGNGTAGSTSTTPQLVLGGHTWKSVQAGNFHTCGITTGDQMYCWGWNGQGQLGIGATDFVPHTAPEPVVGGHSFQALASLGSAAGWNTCGVTTSGSMYCWGWNGSGGVGIGTFTGDEPTPRLVIGGHAFAGPSANANQTTCGVTTAGDVLCWGRDSWGKLGRGAAGPPDPTPGLVVGGHTFTTVTVGVAHACAIDVANDAWCWGRPADGELGNGIRPFAPLPEPQAVVGGHKFTQISAGWAFTCGVRDDGAGLCTGRNWIGQLGRGATSGSQVTFDLVAGGHDFQSIGAGFHQACGVTTAGEAYCWGGNDWGELGDGTMTDRYAPVFTLDLDP